MNTIAQTDRLSEQWHRRKRPESFPRTVVGKRMYCRKHGLQTVVTTNNELSEPRAYLACNCSRPSDMAKEIA